MEIGNELYNNIKDSKITAIKKAIINMGVKYDFELKELNDDIYEFISKQGKIKRFKAFSTFNVYNNWYNENKEKQKSLIKSWTYYVVQLV